MSNVRDIFNAKLDHELASAKMDADKVLFALEVILKHAEDNGNQERIHNAYLDSPEQFGRLLAELIEIELIEDRATTVTLAMSKGNE